MRNVADTKQLILTAAKYSAAAYAFAANKASHWRIIAEEHLTDIVTCWQGNASCFLGVKAGDTRQIWISFAGSNDRKDWADNFDRATVPLRTGHFGGVHVGFARQFKALRSDLDRSFENFGITTKDELIFTGHSLGSALATIAAVNFALIGFDCHAIGIATPRVFDKEAAFYVNHTSSAKITRVESLTDWVCDVPPRCEQFCHVGRGLWIDSKGVVTTEDRPALYKVIQVFKRLTRRQFGWDVHRYEEYVRRLALWCEGSEA